MLASVLVAVRSDQAVPVTLVLGSSGFAVFTLLWTAMTFLLTAPPFSYSLTTIGLVGFAGLAGAPRGTGSGPAARPLPGSAMAGVLWHHGGWHAVLAGGVTVLRLALVVWFLNRRTLAAVRLRPQPERRRVTTARRQAGPLQTHAEHARSRR